MNPKTQHTVSLIIGIFGNLTSGMLFVSPLPTILRIYKSKSTLDFHPYIYLAGVLNCFFWVFYSMPFVHPHSITITTINSMGLFLYMCYLAIFYYYTDPKVPEKAKDRLKIVGGLIAEAMFAAGIVVLTLKFFHTHKARINFVGAICVVFGIILYGSPLSIMWKVMKTKSVEFLPFWVSVAGLCNGVVWSTYACLPVDFYVLSGNGIGALLATMQLSLFCIYRKTTPTKPPAAAGKPSEVQLQTTVDASRSVV